MFSWNTDLFLFLYGFAGKSVILDTLIIFCARNLQWFVIFGSLVFFVYRARKGSPYFYMRMKSVCLLYLPVFLAWVITAVVKIVTSIPRPFEGLHDVVPLFVYGGGDSFPSGHATVFSSLATVVFMKHKGYGILFFVAFVLITLGRIMAGIHYPIDIIAGTIIGVLVTYLVQKKYGTH